MPCELASLPCRTSLTGLCVVYPTGSRPEYTQECYTNDMTLAINCCGIAEHVLTLSLFVCIEAPRLGMMYRLKCYVRLIAKAGMFFVDCNMCQFGLTHPVTKDFVLKGLRLLTNAPWLMGLGRLCTRDHVHTTLEGHWTAWSAEYAWEFCLAYASLLSKAPAFLKLLAVNVPVSEDVHFKRVSSVTLTTYWPERPSYYLTGDLNVARLSSVVFADTDLAAPLYEGGASGSGAADDPVADAAPDRPVPESGLVPAQISAEKRE